MASIAAPNPPQPAIESRYCWIECVLPSYLSSTALMLSWVHVKGINDPGFMMSTLHGIPTTACTIKSS